MNDLDNRFTYNPPQEGQPERYVLLRENAKQLAELIVQNTPTSREQSLALTKLEEVVFWANASIARNENNPFEKLADSMVEPATNRRVQVADLFKNKASEIWELAVQLFEAEHTDIKVEDYKTSRFSKYIDLATKQMLPKDIAMTKLPMRRSKIIRDSHGKHIGTDYFLDDILVKSIRINGKD